MWHVLPALDRARVVEEGGFMIPFTAVCTPDRDEHTTRMVDAFRVVDGTLRREYDRTLRTVVSVFNPHDTAPRTGHADVGHSAANPIRGFLVTRHSAPHVARGPQSYLSSDYLCYNDVVSLLATGSAHNPPPEELPDRPGPRGTVATAAIAAASVMLQQHIASRGEEHGVIKAVLNLTPAIDGPALERWSLQQRANVYSQRDTKRFAFERHATFDGPATLSVPQPLSLEDEGRVKAATRFIARHVQRMAGLPVTHVSLFFKLGPSGGLWFLFAQDVVHLSSGAPRIPAPRFRVPLQYRARPGQRPRPRYDAVFEEDLIEVQLPSIDVPKHGRRATPSAASAALEDDWELAEMLRDSEAGKVVDIDAFVARIQEARRHDEPHVPKTGSPVATSPTQEPSPGPVSRSESRQQRAHRAPPITADEASHITIRQRSARARNRLVEAQSRSKALIAVLDGSRPLGDALANRMQLSKRQRQYLRGQGKRFADPPLANVTQEVRQPFTSSAVVAKPAAGVPRPTPLVRRTKPVFHPKPRHSPRRATAEGERPHSAFTEGPAGELLSAATDDSGGGGSGESLQSERFPELEGFTELSASMLSAEEEAADPLDASGTSDAPLRAFAEQSLGAAGKADLRSLLRAEIPRAVQRSPAAVEKIEALRRGVREAAEYLDGLVYQLGSFYMARRGGLVDRLDERPLLFSIPAGLCAPALEKRLVGFLRGLPGVTSMSAPETLPELHLMLRGDVAGKYLSLYEDQFCTHTLPHTLLQRTPTFALSHAPRVLELESRAKRWVRRVLVPFYRERYEGIVATSEGPAHSTSGLSVTPVAAH